MDTTILSQIYNSIGLISSFIGILAGGVILTYFILPHIAGHIHASFITLVWVTLLLGIYVLGIYPNLIKPIIIMAQVGFSLLAYKMIPYQYAQGLVQTLITLLTLWVVKISFFPHHHHARINK